MPEDGGRRRLIEGELPGLGQHTDLLLRLLDDFVGVGRGNADAITSQAARGVSLEGPSGSGKTALAKAVGKYGGLPFHYLSCPSLFGTDRGDAERGVLGVFQACADKAAASDCGACLLILDEVESIGKVRLSVSKRKERVACVGLPFSPPLTLSPPFHHKNRTATAPAM